MKKIISIILCLAMIFAMAATAFAATDTPTSGASFAVKKVDGDGNPLPGAKFELTDGRVTYPSEVSNPEGIAWFYGVEPGTYTLSESEAPEDYIKSDDTHEIIVNADGRIEVVVNGDPVDYYYQNEPIIFVNEKKDDVVDPITVYIPITKVVEQTGFKAPGAETFKFEVYDFRYQGEVTVVSDTIETNGVGTYEGNIVIEVETIDVISEGFLIKEVKGTKDGWTYSEAVYDVMPVYDDNLGWTDEFTYTIEENGDPVTYDEAVFVNSYYEKFNFAPMNPSKDILDDIIDIFDDDEPEETEEPEEANPNTGAPVFAVPAVMAVLCGAALLGKRK